MENVSSQIIILFILTTLAAIWLFVKAAHNSKIVILGIACWMLIQSLLSIVGFYTDWNRIPPRFMLMILPPLIFIILMLVSKRGKGFIDSLNIETLTILHCIRIPVEITLYYLFQAKLIPQSMTFEGSNFDILSGISAPVVYYMVFIAKKLDRRVLLAWNFLCLALLLNVVITAILSAKTPFQKFDFDQPNIGIGYFPFVLLPSVIVPIVLFSHLASIRKILNRRTITHSKDEIIIKNRQATEY